MPDCQSDALGVCLQSLPPECGVELLKYLDAYSLPRLRRAYSFRSFAREARKAELRVIALDLLSRTKFPFTHNAYVLGLNGKYYSKDTDAEFHYGIPALLPELLCELFSLEYPDVSFTSVRIQRFAAGANFAGLHRTLPFSLHEERDDDEEHEEPAPLGYVLCLTEGCVGGMCESCPADDLGNWQTLAVPVACNDCPWFSFAGDSWLRWRWPRSGTLFGVTVTCEPEGGAAVLRRWEHEKMLCIGFKPPAYLEVLGNTPLQDHIESTAPPLTPPVGPRDGAAPDAADTQALSPGGRSPARLTLARQLLGLEGVVAPSHQEIQEAFRSHVLSAHPDRANNVDGSDSEAGARMSQIAWARRVLLEAYGGDHETVQVVQEAMPALELPAPAEEDEEPQA